MARNDTVALRRIPLSQLFTDPVLRSAFRRAEEDGLDCSIVFAMPPDRPRTLAGGAAEPLGESCEVKP
jgi:hypothetical protein